LRVADTSSTSGENFATIQDSYRGIGDIVSMKITKRQLRQLIVSEASSYQMAKYDEQSNNIMMLTGIIMTGMQMQTGSELDEDDEYEYGQEVRYQLEKYPALTDFLAGVFTEIKSGGRFPVTSGVEDVEAEDETRMDLGYKGDYS